MPAFYIVFIKVHLCTAINRGRFRILVHVIYVRSNKMHLWENLRCTFVGEPLNHIHQDTKSTQLIAVCKRIFKFYPFAIKSDDVYVYFIVFFFVLEIWVKLLLKHLRSSLSLLQSYTCKEFFPLKFQALLLCLVDLRCFQKGEKTWRTVYMSLDLDCKDKWFYKNSMNFSYFLGI